MDKANTPNEAVASIKNRKDAIETITSLYGLFETERGEEMLKSILRRYQSDIISWMPDEPLIELAKEHMREEWKGYRG